MSIIGNAIRTRERTAIARRAPAVFIAVVVAILPLAGSVSPYSKQKATSRLDVEVVGSAAAAAPVTKAATAEPAAGENDPHSMGLRLQAGTGARLLALAGFLLLIVGLLIQWSRDESCNEERSVYSSST